MTRRIHNQRELADVIGIQGATLTHHLNGMEAAGLLARRRDPANRRVHLVELTPAGTGLFHRLRAAAVAHDERIREGFSDEEIARLAELLNRMHGNVAQHAVDADGGPGAPGPSPAASVLPAGG
jgi:MarR family transcriptional regulator, transcriptional regulator for hemolysin